MREELKDIDGYEVIDKHYYLRRYGKMKESAELMIKKLRLELIKRFEKLEALLGDSKENPEDGEFMKVQEASKWLRINALTLYAMVKAKKVPFYRMGPHLIRFKKSDLEEWMKQFRKD